MVEVNGQGAVAETRQQVGQVTRQQGDQTIPVAVAASGAPQQAGPTGNPSFNLVNQGRQTVMQIFASPTTDQNWGPDRLGADTVAPGAIFPVRLPEGPCMYDIRIVYDAGQPEERRSVNLCEITNVIAPLQ